MKMQINKCEFIRGIFGDIHDRIRASQIISRLPIVPTKIEHGKCSLFYDYDELISSIKKYKCRAGTKANKIKKRILKAHNEKRAITIN